MLEEKQLTAKEDKGLGLKHMNLGKTIRFTTRARTGHKKSGNELGKLTAMLFFN